MIAGGANPWLASLVPWLPGMLVSVGSLARIVAGGMRIAAALIWGSIMVAFMISLTADAG